MKLSLLCLLPLLAANLAVFGSAHTTPLVRKQNLSASTTTVRADKQFLRGTGNVVKQGTVSVREGDIERGIYRSIAKGQRGRAGYGGGNLRRPPQKSKSVASPLATPPSFVVAAGAMLLLFVLAVASLF